MPEQTNHATDTIPMRPDETLDVESLATYLRDRLPGSRRPLQIRQFGGGAANLTYLLRFGNTPDVRGDDVPPAEEYVLRRPPLGPVAPSAHDMAREYRVLSVLHRAFAPAPRALLFCEDEAVLGAPFFIMERRRGVVVRTRLPDRFAGWPDAPQCMSRALIDTLVDFHAVDYEALGLESLGKPDGFIARQIEGWYRRWQAAIPQPAPAADSAEDATVEMEALYRWLQANKPPATAPTLIHNDYKLDNVMLSFDDPGKVVAVFDWDMCTLGDPLSDLGALLAYWSLPQDPPAFQALSMMPLDRRFCIRQRLVARYAERSGRDVSHIHFYHALGLYRVAVIIAQIYIRFQRGQTQDPRFATFGAVIPHVVRAALQVTKAASSDRG